MTEAIVIVVGGVILATLAVGALLGANNRDPR